MQIEFTDFAKAELRKIHEYYTEVASPEIASKIIGKILDDVQLLEQFPSAGAKEHQLAELGREHKNIISGNYKVIYRIKNETVFITDIFNCSQNPKKIARRNK